MAIQRRKNNAKTPVFLRLIPFNRAF